MINLKFRKYVFFRLVNFALLAVICSIAYSQVPLKVTKISNGIEFDGIPDEEVWQKIQSLKITMHRPIFGIDPTEHSSIKMAYDDEYFYVSGIFHYNDPAIIRAIGKKRDLNTGTTDLFCINLDTYNDKQNSMWFMTNPNGLRSDATVKNDFNDTQYDINYSWNTFWDVKTQVRDSCWYTEFRIPFYSLRFQVKDGKTIMGIMILRFVTKKFELLTFPPIPQTFPAAPRKPSLTAEIEFEGLTTKSPSYLIPFITGGFSQMPELNETRTEYKIKTTPKFDAGFDAKYSITNNLTLDLTVNTDFAQVEADDQKINLTRYSLVFPEKRSFFLEKSDVSDFSFLDGNNMFYSRRIGIYNGDLVRIYGGLRLTGRIDKWDLGILDMQTAPFGKNPSENFSVFRTKRTVINENSYIGGVFTSRLGMDGNYNLSYGIDGLFKIIGDDYLSIKVAQTFEKDSVKKIIDLSPTKLFFQWQRRNQKGFSYDLLYSYSGIRFNPGVGLERRDNYQNIKGILQYGWFPGKKSVIGLHKISIAGSNIWNTLTGLQETLTGTLIWHFEAKGGSSGDFFVTGFRENLAKTLTLGNKQGTVPPGRYSFATISSKYSVAGRHKISGSYSVETGTFYDGWKTSLTLAPATNIGTGLNISLNYDIDYVNFPERSIRFTNHIIGMKGLLTLTTKTSLSAFVQYNTSIDKVMTNIRFRFNPREGNDFYLVYDEGLNTNILKEVPSLPYSSGRTILLKYTHTFIL